MSRLRKSPLPLASAMFAALLSIAPFASTALARGASHSHSVPHSAPRRTAPAPSKSHRPSPAKHTPITHPPVKRPPAKHPPVKHPPVKHPPVKSFLNKTYAEKSMTESTSTTESTPTTPTPSVTPPPAPATTPVILPPGFEHPPIFAPGPNGWGWVWVPDPRYYNAVKPVKEDAGDTLLRMSDELDRVDPVAPKAPASATPSPAPSPAPTAAPSSAPTPASSPNN